MALTKVSGGILDPGIDVAGIVTATGFDGPFIGGSGKNIVAGIVTCTGLDLNGSGNISGNLVVEGNLTANGDFTTLNTTLREVELLRVDASSDSAIAGIITQSGSSHALYVDGTTVLGNTQLLPSLGTGTKAVVADLSGNNNWVDLTIFGGRTGRSILNFGDHDDQDAGAIKYYHSDNSLNFFTNGSATERLTITSDGKVGINQTAPAYKLVINEENTVGTAHTIIGASLNPMIYLDAGNEVDRSIVIKKHTTANGDEIGGLVFVGSPDATNYSWAGIKAIQDTNSAAESLVFYTSTSNTSGATSNEVIRIKGNSVGIGSVIPTSKLDIYESSGDGVRIRAGDQIVDVALSVGSAGTPDKFVIQAGGNVGIGSAVPNEKLDVVGVSSFTGDVFFKGATSGRDMFWDESENELRFNNNASIYVGDSKDAFFSHDGSSTRLQDTYGHFFIGGNLIQIKSGNLGEEYVRMDNTSKEVKLFYNSSQRLNTTAQGINVTTVGDIPQVAIAQTTTTAYSVNGTVSFVNANNTTAQIQGRTGSATTTGDIIFLCNTVGDESLAILEDGKVRVPDRGRFVAGTDNNISLYHTSSNGINHLVGHPGNMFYHSATHYFTNAAQSQVYAQFIQNSYCELRHSGNIKFRTSETGIDVTGEVKATQDYPDFRPTLDLNFAAEKKLDPRITYQRTGPASFVNEFGKVILVGDNVPRFDHDQDTGECKGLLIEESRTNISPYSNDLSGFSSVNMTKTANDAVAPDGTTTATKLGHGGGGNNWYLDYINNGINAQNAGTYTYSVWVKAPDDQPDDYYGCRIALLYSSGGNVEVNFGLSRNWRRISVTRTYGASDSGKLRVHPIIFRNTPGNALGGGYIIPSYVWVWGAQLEQGAFPTSYIPTAGATRGADSVKVEGEEFSEFYNTTENTTIMLGERLGNQGGSDGRLYSISDGTNNNRIDWDLNDGTNIRFSASSGGTTVTNQEISSWSDIDKEFKIAAGMAVNNQIGVVNGTAVGAADTSCAMPAGVDRLYFGLRGNEGNQGSLTIKRFMFYPKRLPNSQLVTLTS